MVAVLRDTAWLALLSSLILVATPAQAVASVARGRVTLRDQVALQAGTADTPITRVVGLLKEMQATIRAEMEEDEALHGKLSCWCNTNEWEKTNAADSSSQKIEDLKATIERLTARSSELKGEIKQTEADVASNKQELAEATALREKQAAEFHGSDLDSVQAIENLKAALEVLSKHHTSTAAPWGQGEDSYGKQSDGWSFLSVTKSASAFFLSPSEEDTVKTAVRSASAFVQARHEDVYFPSYNSQSGEIVGVLKQLKEEMEGDLAESQKLDHQRSAAFQELRSAKTTEIEEGERRAERKEDEKATTDNDLAEAKEDLGQEEASLSESQKFLANLQKTCADADVNFDGRKKARAEESTAVSETIAILTQDDARDTLTDTYSLLQRSWQSRQRSDVRRLRSATVLRMAAARSGAPELSMLATSVELDAFEKVKKAIDDMISMLKKQQEDEVKKNDWCNVEFQSTEMTTAKTESSKADLEAKESKLESDIKALETSIADAKSRIAGLQVNMQRASEDRRSENIDFQKTVSDQTITVEVLLKALDRLTKYYSEKEDASFSQVSSKQAPPVPQGQYSKNKGAAGVMQMLEKLVQEAKQMTADARKDEGDAQAAYEQIVADTNDSVASLQKEVVTQMKQKAKAKAMQIQTENDVIDTVKELEGLSKYTGTLHAECDFVQKNFGVRQNARAEEIESLQQAKQILSGASLS
jgi:hypothetical protein